MIAAQDPFAPLPVVQIPPLIQAICESAAQAVHARRSARPDSNGKHAYRPVKTAITDDVFSVHLSGAADCAGYYLMQTGSSTTQIAVIDIDDHGNKYTFDELKRKAMQIAAALRNAGFMVNIVTSGSGHGFHLIILFNRPQSAAAVRSRVNAAVGSLQEEALIEVFPKQDSVKDLGNLVAYPFGRKSVALNQDFEPVNRDSIPVLISEDLTEGLISAVPVAAPDRVNSEFLAGLDQSTTVTIAEIEEPLMKISGEERAQWLTVLAALKNTFGESARELAHRWSSTSDKYNPADTDRVWDSIKGDCKNPSTVGTILHLAKEAGWVRTVPVVGTADSISPIDQLAKLTLLDYEKVRLAAAKEMGARPAILDKIVSAARKQEERTESPFPEVDPWPVPVNGAELLSELVATIHRFIICDTHTAVAASLWITMTWLIDVVGVAPLALITAPEKRCGKTLFLTLIGKLVRRALTSSSITPSALFRSIDLWTPTLLIDETDACLKDNEELRGLINCGHTRDSAYTIRCVGEEFTPTKFTVWGAKALSGIGHPADTLLDRSIILELRRKLSGEVVERIRHAEDSLFQDLSAKLARFADENAEAIRQARPALPASLNDRAQDNWEPLLSIATVVGDDWYKTAVAAALKISGKGDEPKTIGTELLTDIQEIFETKNLDRVGSGELIQCLVADDEKPWATYNRGFQIKPRQISARLKAYGIHSKTIRVGGGTLKGYEKDQFTEAFTRYVPLTPIISVTTSQPLIPLRLNPFCKGNTDDSVTDEKACKPSSIEVCDVVTDRIPPQSINSIFLAGL